MFAIVKNDSGDKRPVAAGEVLGKVARKDSSGQSRYGLNSSHAVIMVVLMVEDTLKQNVGITPWL